MALVARIIIAEAAEHDPYAQLAVHESEGSLAEVSF